MAALLYIAYSDIRYRIVSNVNIMLIVMLALITSYIFDVKINLFNPALFLIGGFILFSFRIVGGADVKLIAALSMLIERELTLMFLTIISVFGLVICLPLIVSKSIRNDMRSRGVPYVVAIVFGFITTSIIKFNLYG